MSVIFILWMFSLNRPATQKETIVRGDNYPDRSATTILAGSERG